VVLVGSYQRSEETVQNLELVDKDFVEDNHHSLLVAEIEVVEVENIGAAVKVVVVNTLVGNIEVVPLQLVRLAMLFQEQAKVRIGYQFR